MAAAQTRDRDAAARRALPTSILIFVALTVIYAANFRTLAAGDSLPTRLLPFSILRERNLDLNEFTWDMRRDGRPPYYLRLIGDRLYSGSPLVLPFVVTPLYVVPAWLLAARGISYDDVRARVVIVMMEHLSAAAVAAASAALLFIVLQRFTSRRAALALTAVYAFGTSTWSVSSQALWPHGLSALCLTLLTLLMVSDRGRSASWAVLAGVIAVLAVANRPPMVVFALVAFAFMWRCHRRQILAFAGLPAIGGAAIAAYNLTVYRQLSGGYGVALSSFAGNLVTGITGLLASPNRGLLVYTPIMLFAVWGAVRVWREPVHPWLRYLTVGVALHLVLYGKFTEWWGGYTYGPRYMSDVLPALVIFLVYGLVPFWTVSWVRTVAVILALYGVLVQAIGVYAADDDWNRAPVRLEHNPDRVWNWSDLQILRAARNGWHGGDLARVMIDAFRDPVAAELVPLGEAELRCELHMRRPLPATVRRGTTVRRRLTITNRGTAAWPAFSGEGTISARYITFVLVRWLKRGEPLPGVGDVVPFPENVAPGEAVEVRVPIAAPAAPGDYEVDIRVTQARDALHGAISAESLRLPVSVR